jgi:hypothetical protein
MSVVKSAVVDEYLDICGAPPAPPWNLSGLWHDRKRTVSAYGLATKGKD